MCSRAEWSESQNPSVQRAEESSFCLFIAQLSCRHFLFLLLQGVCTVWNARAPAGTIAASASASFAASTSTSSTAGAPEQCATAVSGVPVASGVAAAPLTVPTLKTQFVAHPGVKPALKVLFSPDSTCALTRIHDNSTEYMTSGAHVANRFTCTE